MANIAAKQSHVSSEALSPVLIPPVVLIPPAYTRGQQVLVSSNAQNMARIWEERTSQQLGGAAAVGILGLGPNFGEASLR